MYACVPVCVCVRTNVFMWSFQSFRANGVNKGTNGLLLGTLQEVVLPGNWTLVAAGGLVHLEVDGGCHVIGEPSNSRYWFLGVPTLSGPWGCSK